MSLSKIEFERLSVMYNDNIPDRIFIELTSPNEDNVELIGLSKPEAIALSRWLNNMTGFIQ